MEPPFSIRCVTKNEGPGTGSLMSNQNQNEEFANTSFLYGGNAGYIEEMYARYQENPSSVSSDWQSYFSDLQDNAQDVMKNAEGASWKKPHWPIHANGELVWTNRTKVYEPSLITDGSHVFAVSDDGIAYCWSAEDGKSAWKKRLGGSFSSSPILCNGKPNR